MKNPAMPIIIDYHDCLRQALIERERGSVRATMFFDMAVSKAFRLVEVLDVDSLRVFIERETGAVVDAIRHSSSPHEMERWLSRVAARMAETRLCPGGGCDE